MTARLMEIDVELHHQWQQVWMKRSVGAFMRWKCVKRMWREEDNLTFLFFFFGALIITSFTVFYSLQSTFTKDSHIMWLSFVTVKVFWGPEASFNHADIIIYLFSWRVFCSYIIHLLRFAVCCQLLEELEDKVHIHSKHTVPSGYNISCAGFKLNKWLRYSRSSSPFCLFSPFSQLSLLEEN